MAEVEPHCCEQIVQTLEKLRPDLETESLGTGWEVFTDGCCWIDKAGQLHAGWAVVGCKGEGGQLEVLRQDMVNGSPSAQAAELQAMVEALKFC